jgi:hypothetical protein
MEAALTPEKNISGDFHLGISQALGDIGLGRPLDALRQEYPRLLVRASTDESTVLLRGWRNVNWMWPLSFCLKTPISRAK